MFTAEQYKRIARIAEKASPQAAERLESLQSEISDLLIAVGIADDGTEYARMFRRFAVENVDHAEIALRFRKIAIWQPTQAGALLR